MYELIRDVLAGVGVLTLAYLSFLCIDGWRDLPNVDPKDERDENRPDR